jgi:hypothetical protein
MSSLFPPGGAESDGNSGFSNRCVTPEFARRLLAKGGSFGRIAELDTGARVTVSSPRVGLEAKSAIALGMVFHGLDTAAINRQSA